MPLVDVPITVTNAQDVDTPAPFQQMIQFNPSLYSPFLLSDLSNVRFTDEDYSALPAWLESYSSTSATAWVRLNDGIRAGQSRILHMLIGTVGFDGQFWGEAPQLSPTYGQYDNGASIFNFYDNFAGTSLNTTKWTSYNSPVITVNNGLTLNTGSSGGWGGIYTASTFNPQTNINDFYAYFTGLGTSSFGPEQTIGWQPGGTPPPSYNLGDTYTTTTTYDLWNYNGTGSAAAISGGSTTTYQIWSLWATSSASYLSLNYGTPVSNTGSFTASTSLHTGVGSYTSSYQIKVQWFRLRAYPPNGVMPGVTVGSPKIYNYGYTVYPW